MSSQLINDLAIVLAKKIEGDLVQAFVSDDMSPSFYNIRETLVKTLQENMDVMALESKDSPMMLKDMTPKQFEEWTNHQLEKSARALSSLILKSDDHFERFEFKDEYDRYRNITSSIIVLKAGKIARESLAVRKSL